MKARQIFFLVCIIGFAACEKPEKKNSAPGPFEVFISEYTSSSVKIGWKPAIDPDWDSVFYSVALDNEVKARSLYNVYSLEIRDLQAEKHYNGSVTATDSHKNSTTVQFEFSTKSNISPESFNVSVSKVSYNSAVIEWERATDADGDSITYTIVINDQVSASGLKNQFKYIYENLSAETHYEGYIRAIDSKNNFRDIPFSFVTKKYFLMFSKVWYKINEYRVYPYNIELCPGGGYILACNGYIPDQNYMMAVKLDSDANIEWSKEIALESGEGGEYLIKPVRDDGYLLLGERRLIRLNRQGEIDWQYVAGEAPDYFRTGLISFISTPDNGVIVVGYYMTLDQETWQQGLMIKINENGEREWQKLIGTDWRTYLYQIESTGNGNYVMAGTSGSETNQELTLTKIDNEGNTLSAQTYPAGGVNFVSELEVTTDNGFIIAGFKMGDLDITEARITRISSNGSAAWDRFFSWYNFKTRATSIEPAGNNDHVFTGFNGYESQQCYLAKIDSNGDLVWNRFYIPMGTDINSQGWDLKATDDGGFIILGTKHDESEIGMWIFKTDPEGNYEY